MSNLPGSDHGRTGILIRRLVGRNRIYQSPGCPDPATPAHRLSAQRLFDGLAHIAGRGIATHVGGARLKNAFRVVQGLQDVLAQRYQSL